MNNPAPIDHDDQAFDHRMLSRELDRVKSKVFLGSNAAFMGSILSGMEVIWSTEVETAATDGLRLWWNPHWFLSLEPDTRKTVLIHELHHPARLHLIRQGIRKGREWNWACDIVINNDLEDEGYTFDGTKPWKDQTFKGMAEEDIYEALLGMNIPEDGPGSWGGNSGDGDMRPMAPDEKAKAINNVVKAIHQAKLAGDAGTIPGNIEEVVRAFLDPVVPWETLFVGFFNDLLRTRYTWAIPDRRFQDIYMPSRYKDKGRLEHLIYYLDVSGSISQSDLIRFNSEVKYVFEKFRPKKMTLVQFDTRITHETVIKDGDTFNGIEIKGRGGTCLRCVRQHILDNKPTAAIVFSDLYCPTMQPLDDVIPIIWVVVGNKTAKVPHGKKIHIKG